MAGQAGSLRVTPQVERGASSPVVPANPSGSRITVGPSLAFPDSGTGALTVAGTGTGSAVYADARTATITISVGATSESNIGTDIAFSSTSSIPIVVSGSGVESYRVAYNDTGTGQIVFSKTLGLSAYPGAFYPGQLYPGEYDVPTPSAQTNSDSRTCVFTVSGSGVESFSVPGTSYVDSGTAALVLAGTGVEDFGTLDTADPQLGLTIDGYGTSTSGMTPVANPVGSLTATARTNGTLILVPDPAGVLSVGAATEDDLVLVGTAATTLTLTPR